MIGKFFHLPKPKQFSIPYRYYNPVKEEQEERDRRIKAELGIKEEIDPNKPYKPNLRGSFRRAADLHSKTTLEERRKSNTRLIVMILILVLIFYLFFYSNLFS